MKSRVSIDVDHDNQPVIKIEHSQSEDVRDKLVKKFLQTFGSESRWAEFYYTDNTGGQINSVAIIRPLSIFEMIGHEHGINFAIKEHKEFLAKMGHPVETASTEKVNPLSRQAAYPLADCLRELKWGRPTEGQKLLDKWIAEAEAIWPPQGGSTVSGPFINTLTTDEKK